MTESIDPKILLRAASTILEADTNRDDYLSPQEIAAAKPELDEDPGSFLGDFANAILEGAYGALEQSLPAARKAVHAGKPGVSLDLPMPRAAAVLLQSDVNGDGYVSTKEIDDSTKDIDGDEWFIGPLLESAAESLRAVYDLAEGMESEGKPGFRYVPRATIGLQLDAQGLQAALVADFEAGNGDGIITRTEAEKYIASPDSVEEGVEMVTERVLPKLP